MLVKIARKTAGVIKRSTYVRMINVIYLREKMVVRILFCLKMLNNITL